MSNLLYQIALTMINSVGPITARQMVAYCGSAKAVFNEKRKNLIKIPNIGPKTIAEILDKKVLDKAERELQIINKNKIKTYYFQDEDYPSRLKSFNDSPVLLYYQGSSILNHFRTIGIVGTRTPTERGKIHCERLISELADYQPLIISGLAYGVDVVSHRKAFEIGLPTLGVMGNGLSKTYPAAHKGIRRKMTQNGGILTEFPSFTGPEREHFPMRNRIIAALSDALVVVESARKGGSMITAHFAFAYNKDVFALPGRSEDPLSAGPNFLIKSNVASLAESADDIAYKMLWEKQEEKKNSQLRLFPDLSGEEQKIIDLIRNSAEKSATVDTLHYKSGFSMTKLSTLLLQLECSEMIKSLPGAKYRLK